eukprot:1142912-Pelagomonas_calceolata.AAC.16
MEQTGLVGIWRVTGSTRQVMQQGVNVSVIRMCNRGHTMQVMQLARMSGTKFAEESTALQIMQLASNEHRCRQKANAAAQAIRCRLPLKQQHMPSHLEPKVNYLALAVPKSISTTKQGSNYPGKQPFIKLQLWRAGHRDFVTMHTPLPMKRHSALSMRILLRGHAVPIRKRNTKSA